MCTVSRLELQFATLCWFHAPRGGGSGFVSLPRVLWSSIRAREPNSKNTNLRKKWALTQEGHMNPQIFLKSIAIHLPFLSGYFCKVWPPLGRKPIYQQFVSQMAPICLAIFFQRRETTIKQNLRFCPGGIGGREENRPKTLFSHETPWQYVFESAHSLLSCSLEPSFGEVLGSGFVGTLPILRRFQKECLKRHLQESKIRRKWSSNLFEGLTFWHALHIWSHFWERKRRWPWPRLPQESLLAHMVMVLWKFVSGKEKTMTMTKISSKKTCYTYGHGPLINLLQFFLLRIWVMSLQKNPHTHK